MKNITIIAIALFMCITTCLAQENCSRKTTFGTAQICLPTITDYAECYLDPSVKPIADGTEVPANMVLGYYINSEAYNDKSFLTGERYEDYFKIYGTKQIQNYKADRSLINEMRTMLQGNFVTENWDQMEKEIDKVGLNVEIGVPTVVKNYSLNDDSFTFVMLTKYQVPSGESYTMAMTMNGLLINERLVWMAYYLEYKGKDSISKAQKRSDAIMKALMNSN